MHSIDVEWAVVVFSSRESVSQLLGVVSSCRSACGTRSAVIDVMINGNAGLATALSTELGGGALEANVNSSIRVWNISLGDKSHAWNTYTHEIWPSASITYFVDGYVEVNGHSFERLSSALSMHPQAGAATGVSTVGRSADRETKFQIKVSGINGNLYALSRETVLKLRESHFRLPLGLYYIDSPLEACLKVDFDPSVHAWDRHRVVVVPDATWRRRAFSLWRVADLIGQWRRMVRQAQGQVEQKALKTFFVEDKKRPAELQETAEELLRQWVDRFPGQWRWMALANPLCLVAIRRVCQPRDWSQAGIPPRLIGTF